MPEARVDRDPIGRDEWFGNASGILRCGYRPRLVN